jgi:hypothetical protein
VEETIICPVCGEANDAGMEFCQNCQWRLRPVENRDGNEKALTGRAKLPPGEAGSEPAVPQWLHEARVRTLRGIEGEAGQSNAPKKAAGRRGSEDLLAGLASQKQGRDDEIPDWVARTAQVSAREKRAAPTGHEMGDPAAGQSEKSPIVPPDNVGAMSGAVEGLSKASEPGATQIEPGAGGYRARPQTGGVEPGAGTNDAVYEWLRTLDASSALSSEAGPVEEGPADEADVPDWVRRLGSDESPATAATKPPSSDVLPDWLESSQVGDKNSAAADAEAGQLQRQPPEPNSTPGLGPEEHLGFPGVSPSRVEADRSVGGLTPAAAAFTPDSVSGIDVDAVFASMQMPDWLSDVTGVQRDGLPPAAREQESLTPADLPSWVQALRPVESAMPGVTAASGDLPLEDRGPLLGLHGVLPAVPGVGTPSSKPGAHSIRIDATDQQKARAALLESIVAAERVPMPMKAVSLPASQRALRWLISALLLITVGGAAVSGSRVLPLPGAVPYETREAIQTVENVPPSAAVLVVFDYEPATVGEMEAAAGPLLDHLLLLKHPRLAVLSTSPTGSAMAERFMSTTLANRGYHRGLQYVNLGYLPGGLTGVYAFALNPPEAAPLDASTTDVWDSPVMRGVTRLSDFATIIVLTDGLESGRVWIEQTASARGSSPLIVVSSAQASPMLLPYADSGQVSGLIGGLQGASGAEQANNGLPGLVRRYWDAYSLGTCLAAVLIVLGGAWNWWISFRQRRAQAA